MWVTTRKGSMNSLVAFLWEMRFGMPGGMTVSFNAEY